MSFTRDITMKQLRALNAAVQTGTVSGAAKILHVTPPAVSLQLKQFEELVGLELLERNPDGLKPTTAGLEILNATRRIESLISDCSESLDAIKGMTKGTVRVGVISTAKYFAPRALAAFKDLHPDIEMNLQVGNRKETVAALEGFEFDFAIMGRPPKQFDVECTIIGPHPHILIAPPDHPLAGKKNLKPTDLTTESFLLREQGSGTRALTEELIIEAGAPLSIGMEMGSNETIKQAVMAGLGIALISAHTVSVELEENRLIQLDVEGFPIERNWQVIRRTQKRLMPAGRALWNFMIKHGHDFLPETPPV
jgi:DNA-binding transcriptional LysR family regulator